ncbi:cryptochrome/photolyase family protein [Lichenicoccus sp.]|uniref:cryptochrome/photolyase family protein n=1 Tax=Lichenicoccus sp. TaxID=2781899 RepID=UPI003D10F2C3
MTARRADPAADDTAAIVWFRNDLRLSDHRPLTEARREAARVLAVFVLDRSAGGAWAVGGAALWWLHHSLAALSEAIRKAGGTLVLREGDAATIIPALAEQAGAASVHCGRSHEPALQELDRRVEQALARRAIALRSHRVSTLFDLDAIRTQSGKIYGVYTPFARTCRSLPDPDPPLPTVTRLQAPRGAFASDRLEQWHLPPTRPDWAGGLRDTWTPGEAGAHDRMRRFLADHLEGYGSSRDIPGDERGTSMLSPHLRWGELSPVQVWHAARAAHAAAPGRKPDAGGARSGFETFQNEILWHEFAAYLLHNNPAMPDEPLRAAYARLRWRRDPRGLQAWQRGLTGVPIVDAGMRQLWHIGWMHNRVRMITASLLTKHLLVSWQEGEAWFWDTLVDGDLATNSASWQWVAGTGTDSQPFFRIFNPVTQGRKFDPEGTYVRRWVPELGNLAPRWLHAPWEAPAAELDRAGIRLGQDYPKPVISLEAGRDRALSAFRNEVRAAS